MFTEAQKWSWGPAQSLKKLLKITALLSIRPRGFEQDNHFSRRNVKLFCVLNPIHVDISRTINTRGVNLPVFNKYSKYTGVLICLRLTNTVICLCLKNTLGH